MIDLDAWVRAIPASLCALLVAGERAPIRPERSQKFIAAQRFAVSGAQKLVPREKAWPGAPRGAASPTRTTRGMAQTIAGRNSLARRPTPEAEMTSAHVLLNLP